MVLIKEPAQAGLAPWTVCLFGEKEGWEDMFCKKLNVSQCKRLTKKAQAVQSSSQASASRDLSQGNNVISGLQDQEQKNGPGPGGGGEQ